MESYQILMNFIPTKASGHPSTNFVTFHGCFLGWSSWTFGRAIQCDRCGTVSFRQNVNLRIPTKKFSKGIGSLGFRWGFFDFFAHTHTHTHTKKMSENFGVGKSIPPFLAWLHGSNGNSPWLNLACFGLSWMTSLLQTLCKCCLISKSLLCVLWEFSIATPFKRCQRLGFVGTFAVLPIVLNRLVYSLPPAGCQRHALKLLGLSLSKWHPSLHHM